MTRPRAFCVATTTARRQRRADEYDWADPGLRPTGPLPTTNRSWPRGALWRPPPPYPPHGEPNLYNAPSPPPRRLTKIAVKGNKVFLNDVILDDPETVRAFDEIPAPERERFLKDAIRVGVLARIAASDGSQTENLASMIQKTMIRAVDDTNKFCQDTKQSLETTISDSLKRTETAITDQLNRFAQGATTLDTMLKAKSRTTQGGREYEDLVGKVLFEIACNNDAAVEHTGDTPDKLGKKGDYVIEFKEGRVVFEIKGTEKDPDKKRPSISTRKAQEEIVAAIKNRDADYGIFVAKDAASLPKEIDAIGRLGKGPYVACGMEIDGRPVPAILRTACHMAMIEMAAKKLAPQTINTKNIEASCREAADALNAAIKNCRNIHAATTKIEEDALKRIDDSLREILGTLALSTSDRTD